MSLSQKDEGGGWLKGNTSSTTQQSGGPAEQDGRAESAPATLEQQLAAARAERDNLLQQDELRRIREEIAALQNRSNRDEEEERSIPPAPSSSSSTSLPKRRAPDDQGASNKRFKKGIKPKSPTLYSGASLKQYRDYIRDCELSHRNAPDSFPEEEDLVTWAMQYLAGDTKESWWAQFELMQESGEPLTWDFYKTYILDTQLDPVNRGIDAAVQFNKAAQRDSQTTRAFATYLATLEEQLPETSEAVRVQHLFSKLRLDIQLAITNNGVIPATREGLIILATTKERNLRKAEVTGAAKPRTSSATSFRTRDPHTTKQKTNLDKSKPQEQRSWQPTRPPPTCYNCGEVGHISPNCTKKSSNPKDKKKGNPNSAPLGFVGNSSGKA